MNSDLVLAGLGLAAALGLAVALWAAVVFDWWQERCNMHKEANMGVLSTRLKLLTDDLRDLAGSVPPGVWQRLRPLANEAEELAGLARQSEELEARMIDHSIGREEECLPYPKPEPAPRASLWRS